MPAFISMSKIPCLEDPHVITTLNFTEEQCGPDQYCPKKEIAMAHLFVLLFLFPWISLGYAFWHFMLIDIRVKMNRNTPRSVQQLLLEYGLKVL